MIIRDASHDFYYVLKDYSWVIRRQGDDLVVFAMNRPSKVVTTDRSKVDPAFNVPAVIDVIRLWKLL